MDNAQDAVVLEAPGRQTSAVIWLHGLGADGHDFEPIVPELGLPQTHGIRFVFPNAPVRPITVNGGMRMRAWYDIVGLDLSQREDAEGILASARIIERLVEAETARGIASDRIVLAGFSQGGAMALHCGLRHAQPLAGILALSAYLPLPDRLPGEASAVNASTPILMAHGIADPVIPVQLGQQSAKVLAGAGYAVQWRTYPIAHAVYPSEIDDIGEWLRSRLPD